MISFKKKHTIIKTVKVDLGAAFFENVTPMYANCLFSLAISLHLVVIYDTNKFTSETLVNFFHFKNNDLIKQK